MPEKYRRKYTQQQSVVANVCLLAFVVFVGRQAGATRLELHSQAQASAELQQDSHNCNSNVDRLKTGPKDWTQIEGSGQLFYDHTFAADETMLSWKEYPRTVGGLAKYLSWFKEFKRPRDLQVMSQGSKGPHSYVSLFGRQFEQTGKLAAFNLEQGSVGNNYFLTVAAALADRGRFIPKLFHQTRYPEEGIFTVRAYVKGRPEDINIDDQFPAYSHSTAFAKPTSDGGWWLPLLEKAFAKVHVNYEMISSGTQAEAARFLTGAPAKEFETNQRSVEEIWMTLTNAIRNEYLITSACFIEKNGLIAGHGYIVKDFVVGKDSSGDEVKLVKVKNPYKLIGDPSLTGSSHGIWTGQFSSLDTTSWTPELRKQAKYDILKTGEFFMTAEDFKDSFKYYTITYLHVGYKNSFIEKRQAVNQRVYKFNFTISEEDYNSMPFNALAEDDSEGEVADAQNVQVSMQQQQLQQQSILRQLSAHLDEGRRSLQGLGRPEGSVADSGASDFEDAIDLMVDSDLEMNQQSETWADSELETEMGSLTQAETLELLELLGKRPAQPKPTSKMQAEKQSRFEDESEEERKDEEDYNNEDHQASMAAKMRQQGNHQKSGQPQQVIMQSGSDQDDQGEAQDDGQRQQSLAEEQPNAQQASAQQQSQPAQQPVQQPASRTASPNEQPQTPAPASPAPTQSAQPASPADDTERAIVSHQIKPETGPEYPVEDAVEEQPSTPEKQPSKGNTGSLHAYIGAELYNKRMFPHGCPSYQKAFVKLFKVERNANTGAEKLKLVDSRFFNNRDGFGYIMRNLSRGDYQIHFKKYSTGFDVYDFTVRVYADKLIRLIDDEDQKITQIELSKEVIDKIPNITDHHQVQKVLDEEKNSQRVKVPPRRAPEQEPPKSKPAQEGPESHYEPAGNPSYRPPTTQDKEQPDQAQPVQHEEPPEESQEPAVHNAPSQNQPAKNPNPQPGPKTDSGEEHSPEPQAQPEAEPASGPQPAPAPKKPAKPATTPASAPAPAPAPTAPAAPTQPDQPSTQAPSNEAEPQQQASANTQPAKASPSSTHAYPAGKTKSNEAQPIGRDVLAQKLKKAASLADDAKNDKFFEIHRREDYYMKDALDKKHGYYYLRIGSDNAKEDMTLKVKMFVRGEQLETSETTEKLFVYKFPTKEGGDQDYRLTTYCKIKPAAGKKACDFLVPTSYHDKTLVYLQKNIDKSTDEAQEQAQQASDSPDDTAQVQQAILSSSSKRMTR